MACKRTQRQATPVPPTTRRGSPNETIRRPTHRPALPAMPRPTTLYRCPGQGHHARTWHALRPARTLAARIPPARAAAAAVGGPAEEEEGQGEQCRARQTHSRAQEASRDKPLTTQYEQCTHPAAGTHPPLHHLAWGLPHPPACTATAGKRGEGGGRGGPPCGLMGRRQRLFAPRPHLLRRLVAALLHCELVAGTPAGQVLRRARRGVRVKVGILRGQRGRPAACS